MKCLVPDCKAQKKTKGYCNRHYLRSRTGAPIEAPFGFIHKVNGVDHKKCSECNLAKPLEEFRKHSGCSGGVSSKCRACESKLNRKRAGTFDRWASQAIFRSKRNDSSKSHNSDLDMVWVQTQWQSQDGKCALSGVPMRITETPRDLFSPSIDRIDSRGFHDKDNCQLVCWGINAAKNNSSDSDFMEFLDALRVHRRCSPSTVPGGSRDPAFSDPAWRRGD